MAAAAEDISVFEFLYFKVMADFFVRVILKVEYLIDIYYIIYQSINMSLSLEGDVLILHFVLFEEENYCQETNGSEPKRRLNIVFPRGLPSQRQS